MRSLIAKLLRSQSRFKSYLGKRTDDIGYRQLIAHGDSSYRLSVYEKKSIKELWGSIIPHPMSIGYSFYEMIKASGRFAPEYLPSAYYMPYVYEALNDVAGLKVLGHKALQPILFKDCRQPRNILSKISGIFYDEKFNPVDIDLALEILKRESTDMIIKPASESSMGRGIGLIKSNSNKDVEGLLSLSDFVIQEKVSQSSILSNLNPTSLNCIRITTLNINNRVTAVNTAIKIGAKGSIVDNIGSGSGGMMIGVSENGILKGYGYHVDGTLVRSGDIVDFAGIKIPNFEDAIDMTCKMHRFIPSMGIIGWDIALDSQDRPVLIEANSFWPGITIEQVAAGPIFGDRTHEVVEFIEKNENNKTK